LHDDDGELRGAAVALAARPDDVQLQRALCSAVNRALQGVLARYTRRLAAWCREADLEDLLQEVLYAVFQKAIRLCREHKLDTSVTGKLGPYFRTIAANEFADQLSKASRLRSMLPLQLVVDLPEKPQAAGLPEEITAALARLESEDRQAVELNLLGKSYAEIGADLGISADAAKMRFHRAVQRLRRLLLPPTEGV
jgi:RNA polymerase sigma factor (sigma-70 family)